MTHKRTALEQAAYDWWKENRPVGWRESKHMDNPTINCVGPIEKKLAEAVVEFVEAELNYTAEPKETCWTCGADLDPDQDYLICKNQSCSGPFTLETP